jgi:hypothetical protein
MKFYGSQHPLSPYYPTEARRHNENESRRKKILTARELANAEMNPEKAAKLHAIADALAQDSLPLPKPKPRKKQRRLFDQNLD